MKVTLSKSEVYDAIQTHMLIKGYETGTNFYQKWTPANGLHSVEIDIKPTERTEEEIIMAVKNL